MNLNKNRRRNFLGLEAPSMRSLYDGLVFIYQHSVSRKNQSWPLFRRYIWLCIMAGLVILTLGSISVYYVHLLDRKDKIQRIVSSLESIPLVNTTRNTRFDSTGLPQPLSRFIEDYLAADLHAYLIVSCEAGIGNRLQSIASAFLIAMLMHRRLIIHWPATTLSACHYGQLFEAQSSLHLPSLFTKDHILHNSDSFDFHGPFDELLCHSNLTLFKQQTQFLFVSTDEYFMSVLMKNPTYSATLFREANEDRLLRSLIHYLFVPIRALQDQIVAENKKMGQCDRGLQMRKNGLKQIPVNGEEIFLRMSFSGRIRICRSFS